MPCTASDTTGGPSRFRPVVRIGNWFEENYIAEDKAITFKKNRDQGKLLVEKARTLYDKFHKEIVLPAPKENVIFGSVVQLMPVSMNIENMSTAELNLALSVVFNERVLRHSQNINEDCELTVAPSVRSCVRNTFRIVSSDGQDRAGEDLKYGQRFCLECMESGDDPIILYSAPKKCNLSQSIDVTYESRKNGELNFPIGLVHRSKCGCPGGDLPMAFTNWVCVHVERDLRFESEGEAIPSKAPLVIVHAATNRNLAVENVVIQTLFGPEFLVSVQNYRNIYKRELWKNVWMISNSDPTHHIGTKT